MIQKFINRHFFHIFLFTYIFGLLLYGTIDFKSIDEICASLLLVLLVYIIFKTSDWYINKVFLYICAVFTFYIFYSLYINSNSFKAIMSDVIIQFKPYLAFCVAYYLLPKFGESEKKITRDIIYISSFIMFILGLYFLKDKFILNNTIGHITYHAAIVTANSILFLFCSKDTPRNKVIFLILLSIGLLSGRSKFYGFFIISFVAILFPKQICNFKINLKSVLLALVSITTILFASWKKLVLYFGVGASLESISESFLARAMLYNTSIDIFKDYFPFGSGFASFASISSGKYYSDIYSQYNIENIKGISKLNYNYIADTYYPCLAQFGVVGVILYFIFIIYILRKSYTLYKCTLQEKYFIIPFLIIGYILIENVADATFTSHRGFFIMMLLGVVLAEAKSFEKRIIK